MKFYKLTLKNLTIDGLVLGLVAFSILKATSIGKVGSSEANLVLLSYGVFLVRWAYLAWAYFYGENANKNPSLVFKILKVLITCGAVVSFIAYFVYFALMQITF